MAPRSVLLVCAAAAAALSGPTAADAFSSLTSPHVGANVAASTSRRRTASANRLPPSTSLEDKLLGLRGGAVDVQTAASSSATALAATPAWIKACGTLAPIASVVLSAASLPTIRGIAKKKSVGSLPLLPYSSLLANASVWFIYGILLKEMKLWSCNAAGVLLALYYTKTFVKHSPKAAPTLPGSVKQHVVGASAIVAAATAMALGLPTELSSFILGKMGLAICIALFMSPMAALATVIRDRSAESIPLPFAVAAMGNCFLWMVFGLLDIKDVNVWFPNVVGFTFGVAQIALKLIFGNGRKELAAEAA